MLFRLYAVNLGMLLVEQTDLLSSSHGVLKSTGNSGRYLHAFRLRYGSRC